VDIIGEVGFFMRGDTNFDRKRDIADVVTTIFSLFLGGPPPPCLDAADANDDGAHNLSDAIFTLQKLFLDAGSFPAPDEWGQDPTSDSLGCAYYPDH
jgi:hypothetical protein